MPPNSDASVFRSLPCRRFNPVTELLSNQGQDGDLLYEEKKKNRRPEEFDHLRLLSGPALDSIEDKLHDALLRALLNDPPREMKWLQTAWKTKEDFRATLRGLVLADDVHAEKLSLGSMTSRTGRK